MQRLSPMLVGGLLLALAFSAQADEQQKKQKGESPAAVVKQGRVQVVRSLQGGEPRLTDEQGKRWLLTGELREELLRLSGHAVKVWGSKGKKKLMTPTLAVLRYELLGRNGRRPLVGLLRRGAQSTYTLQHKDGSLSLKGRPAMLKKLDQWVSCKIWISGELEGKVLRISKFGWLSCKKQKPIKHEKESKQ